jgi:hypothetical protein
MLLRLQVGLEDGLQDHQCRRLHDTVFDRWNPQRPLLAIRLRDIDPPNGLRTIGGKRGHSHVPECSMSAQTFWFASQAGNVATKPAANPSPGRRLRIAVVVVDIMGVASIARHRYLGKVVIPTELWAK